MYNNCTCKSSENIFSSKGGVQEKGKRGSNMMKFNLAEKIVHVLVSPHVES